MKKANELGTRRTVTAGGGLCALAGFAQGLVDHSLLGRFDQLAATGQFQLFLDLFAQQTGCGANWQHFIGFVRQHLNTPLELQIILAKTLRMLVVTLRSTGKAPLKEGESHALQVAFSAFICNKLDLQMLENGGGDDIYCRHAFIIEKFKSLKEVFFEDIDLPVLRVAFATEQGEALDNFNYLLLIAKEELVRWYTESGYTLFSEAMANNTAFAGDLELAILASYWQCTFKSVRKDAEQKFIHTIHPHFGTLPLRILDAMQVQLLMNHGIIDRFLTDDHQLRLLENSIEYVRLHLVAHPDLFALWFKHYQPAPEICCANDEETHWEYIQPIDFPWKELKTSHSPEERKKIEHAYTLLDLSKFAFIAKPKSDNIHTTELQTDALDTLIFIPIAMEDFSPEENQFFQRVRRKLEHISINDVINAHDALCLLDPQKAFARSFPGAKIREFDILDKIDSFQNRHYLELLSAAFAELIEKIIETENIFEIIIKILKQNELDELAQAFQGYLNLCDETLNSWAHSQTLPAIALCKLLRHTQKRYDQQLTPLHNWNFCDAEYNKNLAMVMDCIDLLRTVVHMSSTNSIATAMISDMIEFDFEEEHVVFALAAKISLDKHPLNDEDLQLIQSIDPILESMEDYPVLMKNLQIFFQRLKEELHLNYQNGHSLNASCF